VDGVSDGEGVVSMFFLMRYQSVVASRREINLARQFCRVSLACRTESNFARQFFEVSLFIIAVQQNFRDVLTKCLQRKIALNSRPMANGIPPVSSLKRIDVSRLFFTRQHSRAEKLPGARILKRWGLKPEDVSRLRMRTESASVVRWWLFPAS